MKSQNTIDQDFKKLAKGLEAFAYTFNQKAQATFSGSNYINIHDPRIGLKGPLTKPYMFMQPGTEPKRMYWVGLNNKFRRPRFWYYKKRGWIYKDVYFARPASRTMEWVRCMLSPAHAETTWLRISPEAEAKAMLAVKAVLLALFAATMFAAGTGFGEKRTINHMQQAHPAKANLTDSVRVI